MRRLLLTAAGAAALLVLVPATTSFAAPNHNQATGTGSLGQFGNPTAHVNAVQTPSHLAGSFTIAYPDGTSVSGTPTCLSVSGTTAYVIGRIAESSGPLAGPNDWQPGRYVVIGVQDNGEPGTAGRDKLNFSPGFATQPSCGPNGAAVPVYPIVDGDFSVVG
jgi:hypothetical protein